MKQEYERLLNIAQKAVVCYLIRGDSVLLITRDVVSNNLGQGLKAGVGGKVEPGESYQECLKREVFEEVGCVVTEYEERGFVFFTYVDKPEKNMYVQAFVVVGWDGEPKVTEEGHVTPNWYNITSLPVNEMFTDNQYWVPQVLNGSNVEGYFMYGENREILNKEITFS